MKTPASGLTRVSTHGAGEEPHRGLLLDVEAATEDASSALRRGVVSHRAVDESQLSQVGICDSTRAAAREVGEDLGADEGHRPRVVLEPTSAAFGAVVPDDTVDQGDRAARVRPTQGVRGAEQQSTPVRQDERDDHGLAVPDRDPVQLGGDPLQTWVDVKDPVQLRAVDDGGLRARSGQDQVIGDVQVARGRCVLTRSGDGQHVGPCRKGDRILPGVGVCFLIAARNVQTPAAVAQTPSPGLESTASAVLLTTNSAAKPELQASIAAPKTKRAS